MKIMVTGAAGYIGSILCRKLEQQGHEVVGVDVRDIRNGLKRFHVMSYDSPELMHVIKNSDVIFHMAASSLLGPSVMHPLSYYYNNTSRTTQFLMNLQKFGFKGRFIFASSAAVYGEQGARRCDEQIINPSPINPYGRTKLQTEEQLKDLATATDFDYLAFRFFNVVGAYENLGQQFEYPHILTALCRTASNESWFRINGDDYNTPDGTCIRDYIHVEDVVDLMIVAAQTPKTELLYNIFNVCSNVGISNLELYNHFIDLTENKSLGYCYENAREGDPAFLVGVNYRAHTQFGFYPKINIQSIITSAWNYYKESKR